MQILECNLNFTRTNTEIQIKVTERLFNLKESPIFNTLILYTRMLKCLTGTRL